MSSGRRVLTAEEIFICDDLPREWVPTPEWRVPSANGDECGLYIATLDAVEKEKWEDEITNSKGERNTNKTGLIMASAVARAGVNENGERIFTTAHVEKLANKSGHVVSRLWQTFRKLNIVTDEDVKELAKN